MGCSTKELYEATSGTTSRVASLLTVAQEGLAVGKIAATHALNTSDEIEGSQKEVNEQITAISYEASKKSGKIFPWNW